MILFALYVVKGYFTFKSDGILWLEELNHVDKFDVSFVNGSFKYVY